MAVTLATTADLRLSLGYNGSGSGVCGYNSNVYDAILNPGGMNGNGVSVNWNQMNADMVTVMGETQVNAIIASGAANQQLSWQPTSALTGTYVSSSSFTVPGNQVTAFLPNSKTGRALLLVTNGTTVWDYVATATYGGGVTTVTTQGTQLVAGMLTVQYGQDPNNDPALPIGQANGAASLNSSSKVIQNPASLSTDTTMGGGSPSNTLLPSQAAIAAYVAAQLSNVKSTGSTIIEAAIMGGM